jgi:hypothetical protein
MEALLSAHDSNEIIDGEKFPVINAYIVKALCANPSAAFVLLEAWLTYCETSPHR